MQAPCGLETIPRRRRGGACAIVTVISIAAATLASGDVNTCARACASSDIPVQDFSLIVSKIISIAVISGSLVGKMPQVHAIWKAHSADGVSKLSIWTEAASMGIQFAYNVVRETPLTTYAEVPILYAQMLLLVMVAAWADGQLSARVVCSCVGLSVCVASMALRVVPTVVTASLYAANAALGLAVVLPQVAMNMKNKSTGQLSLVVTAMTFFGVSMRLCTTFVEVEDVALRLTMALNWLLTGLLMAQFRLYRDRRKLPPPPADLMQQPAALDPQIPSEDVSPARSASAQRVETTTPAKVMHYVSAFGSSRCMAELVDRDVVMGSFQSFHSWHASFESFHLRRHSRHSTTGSIFWEQNVTQEIRIVNSDAAPRGLRRN